ncbi:phosphoribosyltransferase [Helicobacter cappadocius]|uniref:Phosphoribosyltransferase family protein n=1 Tax=Helicobacter cappadocius TaxID=3063998 RepID=A0AA90PJP0_9HELI|nr:MULTISPECIES: phosphoribosyltransferase family protein [unclassified Helicobacter]MDO7253579.1 phosphoribosyltransferase family protein [Helicobacter sp. faydin-H75]MDP2539507.1 phosphoribosyltransferase family protein [Helicobacter sp. faydin-H76]
MGTTKIDNLKFENRDDALGRLMDEILIRHLDTKNSIILATSLAGVGFGEKMSKRMNIPLDFLFTMPIYAPLNSECEIAIVSENMDIIMNEALIDSFDITLDYVYGEAKRTYEEDILADIYKFRKGSMISSLNDKDVFIVDQGVETGLTMNVAIQTCISKGARSVYVATPVIAKNVASCLSEICDEVISVFKPDHFVSTAHYYKSLPAMDEEEVEEILDRSLKKI